MTTIFRNAMQKTKPDDILSPVIPSQYDMAGEDMMELIRLARSGDILRALAMAFAFGFVQGNRCTHNRKMRKL